MIVGALTGMRVTAACPPGYRPDPEIVAWADAAARERGGWARGRRGPARRRSPGARALYTDTWVSMGDEETRGRAASPRSSPTGSTTR